MCHHVVKDVCIHAAGRGFQPWNRGTSLDPLTCKSFCNLSFASSASVLIRHRLSFVLLSEPPWEHSAEADTRLLLSRAGELS